MELIYNKNLDVAILVKDKAGFDKLGFTHIRQPEKAKAVRASFGDCTQFFKGTKGSYIACIAQKSDVESMIKLGFVVNVERLQDVNSTSNSESSTGAIKSKQRV